MIDKATRNRLAERKERVRRRINTKVDPENYEFIPAKKPIDYYDNDIPQRVAVYARVSTDNVQQTSSYELQKKYYEDFVLHHPNWTLVKIYADEGISGTSLVHRDEFNAMMTDCRSGKNRHDHHQKRVPFCPECGGLHQHGPDAGGTAQPGGRVFRERMYLFP